MIIVTHDSRVFEFGDRIARMEDGRVVDVERRDAAGNLVSENDIVAFQRPKIDLQFGGLIASVLGMHPTQMSHGLLTFWILPSFCFLLLFPILPLLSHRKERVL